MKLRKLVVPIAAGILVMVLAFFAAAPRSQVGRGPQGEVVRLEKVTYGKKHLFAYGNIWQRIVSYFPGKWLQRFRAQRLNYETTNDTMVAWLVWKGQSDSVYNYVPSYVIEDDSGQRVVRFGNWTSRLHGKDTYIEGRELIVPRRGRKFRLYLCHLDENSKPICSAQFQFSVPRTKQHPEWKPESLPICRIDRNIQFMLTRVRAEKEIRIERRFSAPLVDLRVTVTEDGQVSTNWVITKIEAQDAIGNCNTLNVLSQYPNNEEWWEGYAPSRPNETWKLRLEFTERNFGETNPTRPRNTRSVEFLAKPEIVSTNEAATADRK